MEKLIIYFGITSCLWIGILGKDSVTVGKDLSVLPTPDTLVDANDRVDVTLDCTGSRSELSFYIKNRVTWTFKNKDGVSVLLTESFYPAKHAEELFAEKSPKPHYSLKYDPVGEGYFFNLNILSVSHADNGIYRCSLLNEQGNVTDSKEVKLTVLNPVEKISIEILTEAKESLAVKHTPIMEGDQNVELTPGKYYVKCEADGSNPAPSLSFFFNEQRPSVSVVNTITPSSNRVKNKGHFEKLITVNAHTMPQTLLCNANIPDGHFPDQQAGLTMMVQVDKPDMKCSNLTTRLGNHYAKIMCNVSAEGASNAGLVCEKVSWLLGNENQRIEYDQRWKDPSKKFDIMESLCEAGENGLMVTLNIYHVKPSHFVELYYLVYGIGDNSHRIPVQLHEDTTAGVAGVGASLSLLLCVAMAAVIKHLVL